MEETSANTWRKPLISICCVLLVVAICFEAYRWLANYGAHKVEAHPVEARIEISNPPAWLDRGIVQTLLAESYAFAQKDEATYGRVRNVMDADVLREIAELYTGPGETPRQAVGYNAWIKRITQVRREIAKDKSIQSIQIFAEWRKPLAWVRAGGARDHLYLIDEEGTRLPGEYGLADRGPSKLMVITGVDLPVINGEAVIPPPGVAWTGRGGGAGGVAQDLWEGMKLVRMLQGQQYVKQINEIDMTNFEGRKDSRAAWILLNTVWRTKEGGPRLVHWGRPIGREEFYEVQSSTKLRSLEQLYLRFSRIDADRDYVDIRDEVLRLAKPTSLANEPREGVGGTGTLAGAVR